MNRRILAILFVVLVGKMAAQAAADEPPAEASTTYPFIYAPNDDPFYQEQYHTLLAQAQHILPIVYQRDLTTRLFQLYVGARSSYALQVPVLVAITVMPDDHLRAGIIADAGWTRQGDQWIHRIRINIKAYMQDPSINYDRTLSHELVHVILADAMGPRDNAKIPAWLNEGMAQAVTGEGRERLLIMGRNLGWSDYMFRACQLDGPVDTFANGEGNALCYAEYYVAIHRLAQIGGKYVVGRLLYQLKSGAAPADAFAAAVGTDFASFQKSVDSYTADIVSRRKPIP